MQNTTAEAMHKKYAMLTRTSMTHQNLAGAPAEQCVPSHLQGFPSAGTRAVHDAAFDLNASAQVEAARRSKHVESSANYQYP